MLPSIDALLAHLDRVWPQLAFAAPWLTPWSHDALDWQHLAVPPQLEASHWLGTDRLGRDLFARGMVCRAACRGPHALGHAARTDIYAIGRAAAGRAMG